MYRFIACLIVAAACLRAADGLSRVDLHAHIHDESGQHGSLKPAEAAALAKRLNVRLGVLAEGGCGGKIHDDATLTAFLDSLADQPVWRGLQVYGFEWRRCLSTDVLKKLDYIAADALIFPEPDGKDVRLWLAGVQFSDPEAFMDQYVEHNVHVLSQRIQIWANPTFLPESLQVRYDSLWTLARMDRVIAAAVKNGIAIEINARYHIPSAAFIRRAKAAGAKFSFGSNQHVKGIGEVDWCLKQAVECGLTSKDIYIPTRVLMRE
jgi:hypothetical protein